MTKSLQKTQADFPTKNLGGLQLLEESSYKGVKILRCHSIHRRFKEGQEEQIKTLLGIIIFNTMVAMGIEANKEVAKIFVKEIMECYPHESVEDIQQAFIRGRRGEFGETHAKRGVMSMELVNHWIGSILEKKAQLREQKDKQESAASRQLDQTPIDYESYKKRQQEIKKSMADKMGKFNIPNPERRKQVEANFKEKEGIRIVNEIKNGRSK